MDDEEIGYGKPPRRTQFQRGVSGNPAGRPRRDPDEVTSVVLETLTASVTFQHQGRKQSATRYELVLTSLVERAKWGDLDAATDVLKAIKASRRGRAVDFPDIQILGWLPEPPAAVGPSFGEAKSQVTERLGDGPRQPECATPKAGDVSPPEDNK